MNGKGSFFILLIVIAFLSLSLTVLALYVFVFGGNGSGKGTDAGQTIVSVPKDSELAEVSLFEEEKVFNLKSKDKDEKYLSAIRVSIKLKYFIKVDGVKDVAAKLQAHQSDMRELVGNYFLNMTYDEVSKPETKEKTKKELKEQINKLLLETEKIKTDLVYSVVLEEWFYQ